MGAMSGHPSSMNRRRLIAGLGAAAMSGFAMRAQAAGLGGALPANELGVDPASSADQTRAIQAAMLRSAASGRGLFLPAGTYRTTGIGLPDFAALGGVPGATRLLAIGDAPILSATGTRALSLEGLVLDGGSIGPDGGRTGLVSLVDCGGVDLDAIGVENTRRHALYLAGVGGRVHGCSFSAVGSVGIFSWDARGLSIVGNTVAECGNGGILVWRSETGPDGTIVTGNRI
ncbi:MAG TPA: TIGR03808 family TAT-translocated repetitive protein, partial [Devosiaceae bacterium]|nr:TIGR03808 family TAT-translocated repetitive protein [Devosiaceae bacterium]